MHLSFLLLHFDPFACPCLSGRHLTNSGRSSQPVEVPVLTEPGVFLVNGANAAALHGASYALITSANPAKKGEVVSIFATGLGPVIPAVHTNAPAAGNPLSRTAFTPTVSFGGVPARVDFSGLAPLLIVLYQINATVPIEAKSGSLDLVVTANGVASNPAKIAVQ